MGEANNGNGSTKFQNWVKTWTPIIVYIIVLIATFFTLKGRVDIIELQQREMKDSLKTLTCNFDNFKTNIQGKVDEIYWGQIQREKYEKYFKDSQK